MAGGNCNFLTLIIRRRAVGNDCSRYNSFAAGSVTEPAAAIFSPTLYCFHLLRKIPKRLIQFNVFVDALYLPGGETP